MSRKTVKVLFAVFFAATFLLIGVSTVFWVTAAFTGDQDYTAAGCALLPLTVFCVIGMIWLSDKLDRR